MHAASVQAQMAGNLIESLLGKAQVMRVVQGHW